MCGRFTNLLTWRELVALYRLSDARPAPNWPARYNIAPTQEVPVVRLAAAASAATADPPRRLCRLNALGLPAQSHLPLRL